MPFIPVVPHSFSSFDFPNLSARSADGTLAYPEAVTVFIVLNVLAMVGHTAMILTALFAKTVKRQPTWINFCLAWIFFSFSFSFMLITGHTYDANPHFDICLTQAALIYSTPTMCSISMLALVIQTWGSMRKVLRQRVYEGRTPAYLLLLAPYFGFSIMFVTSLILGIRSPEIVIRGDDQLYCKFSERGPARASASLVLFFIIPTVIIEGIVFYQMRSQWQLFKARKSSLSGIIRIIGFTVYGITAVGVSLIFLATPVRKPALQVTMSLGPVGSMLIFGSKSDMFKAWMFWKKAEDIPETRDDASTRSLRGSTV